MTSQINGIFEMGYVCGCKYSMGKKSFSVKVCREHFLKMPKEMRYWILVALHGAGLGGSELNSLFVDAGGKIE